MVDATAEVMWVHNPFFKGYAFPVHEVRAYGVIIWVPNI
jgi:hypothetical protein